jgi:tRNA(Ile)-lysidine synthase
LGGVLRFCPEQGQGISLAHLQRETVTVRIRQGGERLQPDCKRPRRSLKNLFQEAGTPPWSRQALPLIYSGDRLAAVVGIGVDCEFQARPGEPGILLEWLRAR